ncbi:MAG: amino acid adenylation domain-containing protein [Clostridia bacterium]|nr:amino acid adenylation domain-containing protein [Clostridia bacterium]
MKAEKTYRLSQSEYGIFYECRNKTTAYNLPCFLPLEGFEKAKIAGAVEEFFALHPYLFTQFTADPEGGVRKHIVKTPIVIEERELNEFTDAIEPFEMTDSPLFRLAFCTVKGKEYLFFDFHHTIFDGASIRLFLNSVLDLYDGKKLQPESLGANEYAEEEYVLRGTPEYEKAKEYYTAAFGGLECDSSLPEDQKLPEKSYKTVKRRLSVSAKEVSDFVKSGGYKTSALFLGAFAYLLSVMNMEKEALFATVHNGRDPRLANSCGMFVKTMPFHLEFGETDTVDSVLRRATEEHTANIANNLYSFADASRDLGVKSDIMFAYQGDYIYKTSYRGSDIYAEHPVVPDGKSAMAAEVHRIGPEFVIWFEYRSDLYLAETVEHLIDLYDSVLRGMLTKKDLKDVFCASDREIKAQDALNEADMSYYDGTHTVVDLFREQVEKNPDNTLVVFKDRKYTYKEADLITDRIAARLRAEGIGREDVVSVLIDKSEYIVLASLGVIKSGAAYQPLDPTYPAERLCFMVEDASAEALILDRRYDGLIKDFKGLVLYTDELCDLPYAAPFKADIKPNDLFILLYTSGTTGKPKGVMIEHVNILNFCKYCHREFECGPDSRMSAYASYGFDADMQDIYPAMTSGGAVYVIPEEMRLDLVALGEYFNEVGITHTVITTQVGRQAAEEIEFKTLKHFIVGGEKLVPLDPPKGYKFYNGYGPTEGTVFCCKQPVDKRYHRVPVGKHNSNYKFYILDSEKKRLPRMAKGELYIAGPCVSRGYLNRPEETEKAYIKNPFDSDPRFARMYKTGDIVRMLPDGNIDFLGRSDGQVKIRGFRVELSEVEEIIRKYPGVKDATVKDFADPSGVRFIAAYVVCDGKADTAAIADFIRKNKPPYMVPAYIMQIDRIPLNQNQKVNKKALPEPKLQKTDAVPPSGEAETVIFGILSGILGHEDFGVTTDFADAGLTSVSSIRFAIRLSKEFGRSFSNSELASHPTVRSLAASIGGAEREKTYELRDKYPLTKTQEGIFVECTTHPGTTIYNIPLLLKLDPAVDTGRLRGALNTVIDAHPYLKMRVISAEDGGVYALRDDSRRIEVGLVSESDIPGGLEGLVRPFELLKDDLFRACIVSGDGDKYLFIDAHHIVFDGESLVVFLRELDAAYGGNGIEIEKYTGYEFALDEAERLKGGDYGKGKAYYEKLLDPVDTECVPIRDRDEGKDAVGGFSVDADSDAAALSAFLKEGGVTANALWNAAFGYTLARFLCRDDSVYTTVYNGRSDSRLYGSVGMYVKTLPAVFTAVKGEKCIDAVRRIAKQLTDNMANDIYPFSEISRNSGLKANVMFVYEGAIGIGFTVGGKPAESVKLSTGTLKADLTVFVYETPNGYRLDCEYNARYYEEWSIRSLIESTVAVFREMMRGGTTDGIKMLSAEEAARIDSTQSAEYEVEDTDIVTLFRRAARRYPENDAVIFRGKHIKYKELDALTDKVASYIQSRGVGKGDIVSILVPRGEYMVIASIGALKAGAAYEPLDPSYPPERLNFMVKNASAKLVVSDRGLIGLLSEYGGDTLFIDDISGLPAETPEYPRLGGNDLFIVLYTSGTTGTPKGVMLEHGNLVNFCTWYKSHYSLTSESVVGAYASFGFDADMMDLYPALTSGAAVYIIPEDMRLDLGELDSSLAENKVSHLFMTTQMGRMFAENMPGKSLTHFSVGGETLAPIAPPENYTLWNVYGPTECTIFSTVKKIDRLYYRNPIGSALWNYRLYVVDKNGDRLPAGALGELWISGAGVGRGYLDLPEQTARAFISNPFSASERYSRVYRTGDIVRRLSDGSIDFIGRNDGQVKIRGFRIELSEVESVVREYPGIKNVTIQAFEDKAFGGKFIAAYVVSDEKVDFRALAEFIKSKKPPYMVPAAFMQLDEIPLNQNQKVNKRALPAPVRSAESGVKSEPENELEREFCKVFAGILGVETVGATDNFFELGGTSISAAKVVMFAMNKNYPVVYKDVFDNPTARSLANYISSQNGSSRKEDEAAEISGEEALACNSVRFVNEIAAVRPLGRTLLAGATGFLGSHILRELLRNGVETLVLCRGNNELDAPTRLSAMMAYYFDAPLEEEYGGLIKVVDGDITNADLAEKLKDERIDTVINSAACVKHFASDDIIERINFHGVENLIKVAGSHGARLVQISTLSVAGENIDGKFEPTFRMAENRLYVGQDISNKYVNSKFKAEKAIIDAIGEGLDAKMIRVGNLMGRQSDGEFQINSITNSFIKSLRAYEALGCFPVSACDSTVDFSPVDEVAKTVVLLAKTDKKFTTFHSANSHEVQMGDVIAEMNRCGFDIETVPEEEFSERLSSFLRNGERSLLVSSLLTYSSSDHHVHAFIKTDNTFTVKALYRLGYKWPITDENYLRRMIESLDTLGYFTREDV